MSPKVLGITCYERDEELCADPHCITFGCKDRKMTYATTLEEVLVLRSENAKLREQLAGHKAAFNLKCAELATAREQLVRAEEAWVLLGRWENIAKNGGEEWLRNHPLTTETSELLNKEATLSKSDD